MACAAPPDQRSSKSERRRHPRFSVAWRVTCRIIYPSLGLPDEISGVLRNVGQGGMRFDIPHILKGPAVVSVEIDTPAGRIIGRAQVMWSNPASTAGEEAPAIAYGLRFLDLPPSAQLILRSALGEPPRRTN